MTGRLLTEPEGYEILKRAGIPVPAHGVARDPEEAVRIASEIGFPVVMKIVSPGIIHKSDVGGVIRKLDDPEKVRSAFREILANVKERMPGAAIGGVIVEQELPGGLEVFIGGKTDPAFGKVLTFGMGGTLVEILKDVALRVLPLRDGDAKEMVEEIRGHRLITGYRGEPPRDLAALVSIIEAAARMFIAEEISEFDLNPLILYENGACAVDARIYRGADAPARPRKIHCALVPEIFSPESIAVVGASGDPRKVGYAVFRNLLSFPGRLYAVNPNRNEVQGRKTYPSIAMLPEPVHLVVIAVPAKLVPGIVEEAGRAGTKAAIILAGGFGETGTSGKSVEGEIVEIARRFSMRILGPNCLGIMLPHKGINTTFDPITPRAGRVAFISQSGAVIATMVDWSVPEEIGFSAVISVGNQADLGFEDFLFYLRDDQMTRAIVMYIEEVKDGAAFLEAVERVSGRIPVIAIKSGISTKGQLAASSHTGALAGSHEVYMAAFRKAGIITTQSLREAFLLAELLASEGYPHGRRGIVITGAGGFAVFASDYADLYGVDLVELPAQILEELTSFLPAAWSHENPMDLVGDSGAEVFAKTFDVMIRHQEFWDIAFVIAVPDAVLDTDQLAQEIVRFSRSTKKMVVGCLLGGSSMKSSVQILRSHQIPNFADLEDAFRVVGRACSVKRPGEGTDPGTREREDIQES
ncbi:MAG: acetate--CoA ligase family protein [Methanomicrobiales archaeon]|nr:acetate--CoA ligase family protein [Methanomicrobiales archaeon]